MKINRKKIKLKELRWMLVFLFLSYDHFFVFILLSSPPPLLPSPPIEWEIENFSDFSNRKKFQSNHLLDNSFYFI